MAPVEVTIPIDAASGPGRGGSAGRSGRRGRGGANRGASQPGAPARGGLRVRLRTRTGLIAAALAVQGVVLGLGWVVTFRTLQREFAERIREQVTNENRKLAQAVEALFPPDALDAAESGVDYGSEEWDRLQRIIENEVFSDLPAGAFACLIQGDGQLLCHPEIRHNPGLRDFSFNRYDIKTAIDDRFGRSIAQTASRGGEDAGVIEFKTGDYHYVATRPLGQSGLQLLIHQPVGSLVMIGREATRFVVGITGGMSLVVLGVTGGGLMVLLRRYDSVQEALNRQLLSNLQTARRIQESTLPTSWPQLPGYDVAAWSRQAEETGGDTFDVIGLAPQADGARITQGPDARSLAMLLADATGHGVGPAIAVTQLQAMARIAWRSRGELMGVAELIGERLAESLPEGRFITAWMARLDAKRDDVEVFSAGQGPYFKFNARGGVQTLSADTIPFGIRAELGVDRPTRLHLEPGDLLIVPSDGIIEAPAPSGERFGAERLVDAVADNAGRDAASIAEALRRAVEAFTGGGREDDQTLLVIKRQLACKIA